MLETLAHQGGWDEAGFVVVPIAIFFVLLVRAKHRAEAEPDSEVGDAVETAEQAPRPGTAPPPGDADR